MSWKPAACITELLKEANALAPNRSKSSDGIIGDAAHSASVSDHNPDDRGIVHAIDVTQDPAGGWDCDVRVAQIVAARDRRIKYIIWDRHMWRSYDKPGIPAWSKAPYSGASPHTDHMHVSVLSGETYENDVHPWFTDEEDDVTKEELEAALAPLKKQIDGIEKTVDHLFNFAKNLDAAGALQAVKDVRADHPKKV